MFTAQHTLPRLHPGSSHVLALGVWENLSGTEEEGGLPQGSAPGGATEVETYFRESRIWFFFRASARALAPAGPMELLRSLGRDRQKSQG